MIVFADSSALVSHYAPAEADAVPRNCTIIVSALARVEVVSGLWRKERLGELTISDATVLVREFEVDWNSEPGFRPIAPVGTVLTNAARLTGVHLLRTLDAIQLASALAARDVEPECRTMVVLDERLRGAAAREGFNLFPVA